MGHDWREHLDAGNSLLMHGPVERADWDDAVARAFGQDTDPVEPSLVHDFLVLGLSWFLVASLSRRMHYFIDPDEARLSSSIHDAAGAALQGDIAQAREALSKAFECLLETREQLFPMDCNLVDLCLPGPAGEEAALAATITECRGLNLLVSPSELEQMSDRRETLTDSIRAAVAEGTCSLVSGGWYELRSSLGSFSTAYSDLLRAAEARHPLSSIWGQKRFGLYHSLPGLLNLFDFRFAVHVALDDGLYPEREYGPFDWQGSGGTSISATSRLPVAIDTAVAFLRIPERLAETMQQDATATLTMARLPQLSSPWLSDLRRIHELSPLMGRFVTLNELAENVDCSKDKVSFQPGDYLAPHLIQAAVFKTEWPVTGPADLFLAQQQLERLAFLNGLVTILHPDAADATIPDLDHQLQDLQSQRLDPQTSSPPEQQHSHVMSLCQTIDERTAAQTQNLAERLPGGTANGMLVVNPLPFGREATLTWPDDLGSPAPSDSIVAAFRQKKDGIAVRCKVPPGGFVQLPADLSGKSAVQPTVHAGRPLAEDGLLRNQFFEVLFSETSGGITDVRFHGHRANRVSQQVAFRYDFPKNIPATKDEGTRRTSYATTSCRRMTVVEASEWQGSIETECEIRDVPDGALLLKFLQRTTVQRSVPRVDITILPQPDPEYSLTGNPWMKYFACRFAWNNEAAAITRCLLGQACGFSGERFESPDYIEIADEDHRLLIVPHGRPWHRRSGPRMLDSLLLVDGQEFPANGFRFTLAFDEPYPRRTVLDILQPPITLPVDGIGDTAAWLVGVSAKNVQIERIRTVSGKLKFVMQETEGQSTACQLRIARPPSSAFVHKATGRIIEELDISDSRIALNFRPFEIKEVHLTF